MIGIKNNMKLFEISSTKYGKNIKVIKSYYDDYGYWKKIGKIDGFDVFISKHEKEYEEDGERTVILIDPKRTIVGKLDFENVDADNDKLYRVQEMQLISKVQGRNIGYKLYAFLITKMGFTIISGNEHSLGSQKMYMKLAKHPNITAYGMGWDDEKDKGIYTQLSPDEIYARLTGDLFDVYDDDDDEWEDMLLYYEKEIDDLYSEIDNLNEEIDDLNEEIDNLNEEIDNLDPNEKEDIKYAKTQIQEIKTKIRQLKTKRTSLNKYAIILRKKTQEIKKADSDVFENYIVLTKKIKK